MPASTFKSLDESVADMLRWYYYRTQIAPDSRAGSLLRTTFEAVGFVVEQLSHRFDTALTEAIPEAVFAAFGFEREAAQPAFVALRFSRANPAPENYPIPAGTLAQTSSSVVFATSQPATLAAGTTHVEVMARCLMPGVIGNVPPHSVTQLNALLPGVETVTNPQSGYGGVNAETRDDQAARFARYLATLAKGTPPALTAAALAVRDEHGHRAHHALVVDTYTDDTIPLGTCRIYLYRPGGVPQTLLDAVLAELEFSQRPVGVRLEVAPVTTVSVDVTATIYGRRSNALGDAEAAAYRFFDQLAIGEGVDYERLIAQLVSASADIYSAKVFAPATSVPIGRYERAEVGTLTLLFEEV